MNTLKERPYDDPAMDEESRPFWQAAKEGKLLLKHCTACAKTHYYPRTICPHCFGNGTQWRASSGRGTIYSYSVARRAEIPYVVAYVTLQEEVTILSNIVECDPDQLSIGQEVELTFRQTVGGWSLPVFKPCGNQAPLETS